MTTVKKLDKYMDPKVLTKIKKLDLAARLIVEGFITGRHRSPFHAFSVEFAQHREYAAGDDLRHLDWKVFAKSDRYYIKQYEAETNLRCSFLLDTSESMAFTHDPNIHSKLEYAKYIVASLAYLLTQQQDAVGLVTYDNQVGTFLRPGSSPAHFRLMLHTLAEKEPANKSNVATLFDDLAQRLNRRGLVVILSDLFDTPENILKGLSHFRMRRHEVIVFHIMDQFELTFPYEEFTMFEGMEGWADLLVDPRALRAGYMKEMNEFSTRMERGCQAAGVDYIRLDTSKPLDVELAAYLAWRLTSKKR